MDHYTDQQQVAPQERLLKHIANVDILHLVIPQSMGDQCLDPLAVEVDKLFECLPISRLRSTDQFWTTVCWFHQSGHLSLVITGTAHP